MMPPFPRAFLKACGGLFSAAFCLCPLRADQGFPAAQIDFFEKNVRPVLAENCHECHGAKRQKNGLRLDSREAVLRGSDFNRIVVAGDPENSLLIKAVRHAAGPEPMPSKKPQLASNQIEALAQWIKMGLPWPVEAVAGESKPKWEQHWAFQPVLKPAVPQVSNLKSQISNPIDAFVAAKLRAAGLDFAPPADAASICRRLYLDLTGLPPTFEEVQAFVSDKSPDALAKLAARLLDSPRYGERWARHWLDVARYSDTEGYRAGGVDIRFPYAYTYRDWVIAALNADMPYDRFLMQQLAADKLLESTNQEPGTKNQETGVTNLAGLGFLTINDYFLGDRTLQIDDRIDVVSRGMLGITIGCARCHDHKYDPITSKDYYSLYSVFNSCEQPAELPVFGQSTDKAARDEFQRKVAEVESKKQAFRMEVMEDLRKPRRLAEYLVFAQAHRDEQGGAFSGAAGKAKLRDRIAAKWRDFIKREALTPKPHPAMRPWSEFANLPPAQFGPRAAEIARRLADPATGVNAVLRNEFAKRPAPKDLGDVAAVYGDVFATCIAGKEPDNADWKQLRALLAGPASPMSVGIEGVDQFFTRKDHERMTKFSNEMKRLELSEPGAPLRAMVLTDTPRPRDVRVFVRGNPARQGDPAPRGWPAFLGGQKFTAGSGRLELARAIASKDNPLTARVLVNRVWMEHFGKPLVAQPSDFGVQSPKPEQAELLDYLAATFMESGWSLKKLHQLIVTSRTWGQSCMSTAEKDLKDADNNLLSRFNRLRLDYEAMRDSVLAVTGSLDTAKSGGRATPLESPDANARRSVYLFVDRYEQPTVPAMFDFANPDRHSPQRFVTTVPQQALFLMNSPFMRSQAEKLAAQLPGAGGTVDAQGIKALYRRVLQRDPKPGEVELARRFVSDAQSLQSPAFLWRYGSARVWKDEETGKVAVTGFTEFKYFEKRGGGHSWSPGPKIPDPKWRYCYWGSGGGHAGEGDIAPLAQWTAPFDAEIRISGSLSHPNEAGNGVHGWIVSSRTGILHDAHAGPKGSTPMGAAMVAVMKGDVLTFAVTSEGDTNSDSFTWAPVIERIHQDGRTELLTDAKRDFCGPEHWPIGRTRPQSPLSQLAQVLLMSSEFQFSD